MNNRRWARCERRLARVRHGPGQHSTMSGTASTSAHRGEQSNTSVIASRASSKIHDVGVASSRCAARRGPTRAAKESDRRAAYAFARFISRRRFRQRKRRGNYHEIYLIIIWNINAGKSSVSFIVLCFAAERTPAFPRKVFPTHAQRFAHTICFRLTLIHLCMQMVIIFDANSSLASLCVAFAINLFVCARAPPTRGYVPGAIPCRASSASASLFIAHFQHAFHSNCSER